MTQAAGKRIVAGPAKRAVTAATAEGHVVVVRRPPAETERDRVALRPAQQPAGPHAADEQVEPPAAKQRVAAAASVEMIIAGASGHDARAGASKDQVDAVKRKDRITAVEPPISFTFFNAGKSEPSFQEDANKTNTIR